VNLKLLIGKLNSTARTALEGGAGLCLARTHYDVEIEHVLFKLLDLAQNDTAKIFRHYGVDTARLQKDLERSLDNLKSGNARTPAIGPYVMKLLTEAWNLASIDFNAEQIRTGYLIVALLQDPDLSRLIKDVSNEVRKIPLDGLKQDFAALVATSSEETQGARSKPAGASSAPSAPADAPASVGAKTPNLDQYTVNMTERAKQGKLDPVLGRDSEIRQAIDILTRRRQNNPILTGEAGVGKTAVVEGLAQRIALGDVPPSLQNVSLRSLDLALLQAGAGIKGEFENRLKSLVTEVSSSPTPIILFIDEAHTMIGAGGQAGQNDAANILKPALARGELRTIAATTWAEYKKFFEKDAALARRFQVVKVDEPNEARCMVMLRGVVASLEKHHNVRILDEGVSAAVRLSHRYIAGRQLPDKAVSVLDTACARLSLSQNAIPAPIEDTTRQIDDLVVQDRVLRREVAVGADHNERLGLIGSQKARAEERLALLKKQFDAERDLVFRIRDLRAKIEESPINADAMRADLAKINADLDALQGEKPLMQVCVNATIVGEVISAWTGIPVGKMLKDDISVSLQLEQHLGARVIGQEHALEAISQRIRTHRAGLEDPGKPVGVFLLVGPSGVGKTETALALADLLYGGERNLITINMSEFQEAHTVSTLKGSPPGYVGYGEGGVLTEAVRRRPYSVVLLDEVEKAHPDVLELFFQVFDKGQMEDGEGREIDFKNTIIILTSNAGTETLMKLMADPETAPSPAGLTKALKPELNKIFKPAFLGRMVIVPYFPVRDEALKKIIHLKLAKVVKRLLETHKVTLEFDETLIDEVANRCTEVESGARNVDNILTNTLLPEISRQLLGKMAAGEKLERIRVSIGPDSSFIYA
jgi:type VI secretion system protein VasG